MASDDLILVSVTGPVSSKPLGHIPIYYKVPFGRKSEIVSGYLRKKKLPDGSKDGAKRFFGHFECGVCEVRWKSSYTWQGYTQACRECEVHLWPKRVYHLEQTDGSTSRLPHKPELCQKCQELGRMCLEGWFGGEGDKSDFSIYDQCFEKQFQLLKFDIMLEPKFILNLYRTVWPDCTKQNEFFLSLRKALKKWTEKGNSDQMESCKQVLHQISLSTFKS